MSEQSSSDSGIALKTQAELKELASSLRTADHLDAETQASLAALLDEIGAEISSHAASSAHTARLAAAVAAAARSLHQQHPPQEITAARESLKEAASVAEIESPAATGLAYRLVDLLSSIGI